MAALNINPKKRTDDVICLDIEKTHSQHTIEIAMVKLSLVKGDWGKHLSVIDSFDTLVKPPVSVDNYDEHLISDADLRKAPSLGTIVPKLLEFTGQKAVFVAHSCSSEYALFREMRDLGYYTKFWVIDTKEMSKALAEKCFGNRKFLGNAKLNNLSQRFRCPRLQPHRALDDALACANLYIIMRQFLRGYGYKGWKGFERLAKEHNFIYLKDFMASEASRQMTPPYVAPLSRIPAGEKAFLQKLYFALENDNV